MSDKPMSVSTLAERWGCSRRHITNMVKRGELHGFRVGALLRFTMGEVEAYECGKQMVRSQESLQIEALEI